jgi:perosamine synthetase
MRAEAQPRYPKSPVLDWADLRAARADGPCVADLPHVAYTSSGRAALSAALAQMTLPQGSGVLVPTYHCPTMIAPVVAAGLVPVFYGLSPSGRPVLVDPDTLSPRPRALFVAHYFGLPRSLAHERAWCDAHGVRMVEDCAHSYFGMAGERPVGAWGDYAITSLSKFFPVREAGLLASKNHPLRSLGLQRLSLRNQVKAGWDVVHWSHDHRALAGLSWLAAGLLRLRGDAPATRLAEAASGGVATLESCDMARVHEDAAWAARWIHRHAATRDVVAKRRANFQGLVQGLMGLPGMRVLHDRLPIEGAPYVVPLCVDDRDQADALYARMRLQGLPVFRWDRWWPGTPQSPEDTGLLWGRQILQVLCHQSLGLRDVADIVASTRRLAAEWPCTVTPPSTSVSAAP